MQVLGPSMLAVPGSEPFTGAGEQMRWSYWQAWANSGTDWADLAWACRVGISNAKM